MLVARALPRRAPRRRGHDVRVVPRRGRRPDHAVRVLQPSCSAAVRRRRRQQQNGAGAIVAIMLVSILVYAMSFLLTRSLSRYRELSADRSGAMLTGRPSALASALQKVTGDDRRGSRPATCAAPSRSTRSSSPRRWPTASASPRCSRPTRRWRSGSRSSPRSRSSSASRSSPRWGCSTRILGRTQQAKPDLDALFALPSAAVTLQAAGEPAPDRRRVGLRQARRRRRVRRAGRPDRAAARGRRRRTATRKYDGPPTPSASAG